MSILIKIELPKPALTITQREQKLAEGELEIPTIFGFIDFHQIPRDKGGIFHVFQQK